jgi:hypothetical protein
VLYARRATAEDSRSLADLIEKLLRDYLKKRWRPRLDCCCQDSSHKVGSLPNAKLLARGALIGCPKSQT